MGCVAGGRSSRKYSTKRRLDRIIAGEERFECIEQLGRVPFRSTFDPAKDTSFPTYYKAGRQTLDFESPFRAALWIEIELDRFEPEFLDERLDDLVAAAILGYREDDDILAQARLHSIERRHLAQAWHTPGGPEVEHDELAAEIGEAGGISAWIDKGEGRRRLRRQYRNKLTEAWSFRCTRFDQAGAG